MDHLRETSLPAPGKTRRRYHTPEFKAKIVTLSKEPGTSIALLAQQYQLNANLIHKWGIKGSDTRGIKGSDTTI